MNRCFGLTGVANTFNGGLDCTRNGIPMASEVILAMTAVWAIGWCCGSPCPSTAKLPIYTAWYIAGWYAVLVLLIAAIQLRGESNPMRARLRTLMGLRSVQFMPEEVRSTPVLDTEMSGRHPARPDSAIVAKPRDSHADEAPAGAAYSRRTVWRLAWPWATPLFLLLATWTQILIFWTMGGEEAPEALGLIAPDPRPSSARLDWAMARLNVSNVTQFLQAAPDAAASFGDVDAAQLAQMQAARSADRWLSYMLAHASVVHLINNVALQIGSGVCLEMLHGSLRTAAVYLVSGVTASLAFTAFPRQEFTMLVGGSAACFGIVGAQLANCVLNWAEMPFGAIRLLMLSGYLAMYTLFSIAWPVATAAHGAHLVGLLQGFLLGLAVLRNFVVHPWQRQLQAGAAVAAGVVLLTFAACNAAGTGGALSLQ